MEIKISLTIILAIFTEGYIQENKLKIIEGALRCKELKSFLIKIDAPLLVWLSEDGSGINSKVVYDSKSNKLVGLNLPLHELTGMPISNSFIASSLQNIEKHLKSDKSKLVYIVIAQPIKDKSPPFVLQLFGTDNKFKRVDVLNRWKYTKQELEK